LVAAFRNSEQMCQVIVKSELLKDAIQELNDVSGAAAVRVKLNTKDGMMVDHPVQIAYPLLS
jgi:hypothetical protein